MKDFNEIAERLKEIVTECGMILHTFDASKWGEARAMISVQSGDILRVSYDHYGVTYKLDVHSTFDPDGERADFYVGLGEMLKNHKAEVSELVKGAAACAKEKREDLQMLSEEQNALKEAIGKVSRNMDEWIEDGTEFDYNKDIARTYVEKSGTCGRGHKWEFVFNSRDESERALYFDETEIRLPDFFEKAEALSGKAIERVKREALEDLDDGTRSGRALAFQRVYNEDTWEEYDDDL